MNRLVLKQNTSLFDDDDADDDDDVSDFFAIEAV